MSQKKHSNKALQWLELLRHAKQALAKGHRRYLLASIAVHVAVVVAMTWSWNSTESVKMFSVPQNIQARVLTAKELDQLPYKKRQLEAEAERKRQEELKRKKEQAKKKELERRKKKAAEEAKRKKAEAIRKEAEKKKILAQKKKEAEALKKQEAKKAKELAEQAERLQKQQEQKELDRLKDFAEKREQSLREKRLAERLKGLQDLGAPASNDEAPQFDMDEKSRFIAIIKRRIESQWYAPPNSSELEVLVRIKLLPSGELSGVEVLKSSGSNALDESVLSAVRSVERFEVPKDPSFFEEYFRTIQLKFSPDR